MLRATEFAHQLVRERVSPGATVMDATLGNGHDTVFLAKLVGASGIVHGFDIQPAAIASTRRTVAAAGLPLANVRLHGAGHECMMEILGPGAAGSISAVMFNLGYLPGGDKSLPTRPATTLKALHQAEVLLARGGILTVVVYPGHPGGEEEAAAVREFFAALSPDWHAIEYRGLNSLRPAPFLLAAERRK